MKSSFANWYADQLTMWMQLGHCARDFKLDESWSLMKGFQAQWIRTAMSSLSEDLVMGSWVSCGIPPEEMQTVSDDEMLSQFLESEKTPIWMLVMWRWKCMRRKRRNW